MNREVNENCALGRRNREVVIFGWPACARRHARRGKLIIETGEILLGGGGGKSVEGKTWACVASALYSNHGGLKVTTAG